MKISFHTGNVQLLGSIKSHYEGAIGHLQTLLGRLAGDHDTTEVIIRMKENKHNSGQKYELSADLFSKGIKCHASSKVQNLDKGAHVLYEKLKRQITRHHSKLA